MSFAAPTIAFTTIGQVFPQRTMAVDLNRDGVSDLFTAFAAPPLSAVSVPVQVLLGTRSGFFSDNTGGSISLPRPTTINPTGILAADFNRDGRTDLFVTDAGRTSGGLSAGAPNSLLVSSASGFLVPAGNANLPAFPDVTLSAAAGDVNRDGFPDLYVANGPGSATLPPALLINDRSGGFVIATDRLPPFVTETTARTFPAATFVDLDGNGAADLYLGGDARTSSAFLVNDGSGFFSLPSTPVLPPKPFAPDAIATAAYTLDLGADGREDVIALYTRGTPAFSGAAIQFLVNRGGGTFVDETAERLVGFAPLPGYVDELQFADVDRDGALDFITQPVGGVAQIFINNGDGYFSRALNGVVEGLPTPFQSGDFDGDANIDLAAWNNASTPNTLLLYRGDSAFPVRLSGTAADEALFGTARGEVLAGFAGNDTLRGGAGDDTVNGGSGNDFLDGGSGTDTAEYAGARSLFTLMGSPDGRTAVVDRSGAEGVDQLVRLERGVFAGAAVPLGPVESPLAYIASYADLIAALGPNGQAGYDHFVTLGVREGRVVTFNGLEYIASYGDLIRAFGPNADAGTTHYIVSGVREGRAATFSSLEYIASYGDLIRAFGANAEAGATHFITAGAEEGRRVGFDGLEYIASYRDLVDAFGANADAGAAHYILAGSAEGRAITFDGLRYIASYADLIGAFGPNTAAGTTHFIQTGVNEGRSISFDPVAYLARYADLQAAFGSDTEAATLHFITTGFAEGRSA